MKKEILIITGPTSVGKTDFVNNISNAIASEIVNLDVGQFYTPFSIGTAKPDWKIQMVPHHLFDIIDKPINYTVHQYRIDVINKVNEIWNKNKLPILVGGSGFYLLSLFFPPLNSNTQDINLNFNNKNAWQELYKIDPIRAEEIDKHDPYRIQRALAIAVNGILPSTLKPEFNPFCSANIIVLTRNRKDLYNMINSRTEQMLKQGWIKEVENATSEWKDFLKEKKLIGYDDILKYINGEFDIEKLKETIKKKTRNYAKRQETFFKMLERRIREQNQSKYCIDLNWLDLTLNDLNLYIKQLRERYISEIF